MSGFQPRNPDFEARVRDSFARQGFMKTLGARLNIVRPGFVEVEVDRQDALLQQHGYFHGGVIGTIADTAGGYAAFTLMAASDSVLTIEYKLNIMKPGSGEKLIARCEVLRPGARVNVCQVDVFSVEEGKEVHCARMLGTFITLQNAADE